MSNNEVYIKNRRRYLFNKFLINLLNNKYVLLSLGCPLTIMFFIRIYFAFKNVLMPYNFSHFIFVYIMSFFATLYNILIAICFIKKIYAVKQYEELNKFKI